MESKDLRIGNIVSINGVELLLTSELFCLIVSGDVIKPKPIPLTEEWLIKAGFESGFSDCQFMIKVTKDCSMAVWINDHDNNCLVGDELELTIKHVHQLQNLYWCLTGEELTFDL